MYESRSASLSGRVIYYYPGSFALQEDGAQVRAWGLLRWLTTTFHHVTVYSFRNWASGPWGPKCISRFQQDFPNVDLILETRTKPLEILTRIKNAVLTLAPWTSLGCLSWHVKGLSPDLDSLKKANPGAVFVVTYSDGLAHLNGVDPTHCVVEIPDVKFAYEAQRSSRPIYSLRIIGKLRNDAAMLEHSAGIITIAPAENLLYRLWYPDKPNFYVARFPTIANVCNFPGSYEYDLLFVGSDVKFNVVAIVQFLQTNAAWVADLRVALVGKVCQIHEVLQTGKRFPNVKLLGFVEDVGLIYAQSKLVISPMNGTGIKNKAVEALQHGKPVLASQHTMDGLPPGFKNCVFPVEENIAKSLLQDDVRLEAARSAAFAYAATLTDTHEVNRLAEFIRGRLGLKGPVAGTMGA